MSWNASTVSLPVSVLVPDDDVFTGRRMINLSLRNTELGSVRFTTQDASVTVIDNDGESECRHYMCV